MKIVQRIVQEKTGLIIDQLDSSGGQHLMEMLREGLSQMNPISLSVFSTVAVQHRPALSKLQTQLSAI